LRIDEYGGDARSMSFRSDIPYADLARARPYDNAWPRGTRRALSLIGPALATCSVRDPPHRVWRDCSRQQPHGQRGTRDAPRGRTIEIDAERACRDHRRGRRQTTSDQQRLIEDRSLRHAAANASARIEELRRVLERSRGWDSSPVSTARL